jgi:hypothetical protein
MYLFIIHLFYFSWLFLLLSLVFKYDLAIAVFAFDFVLFSYLFISKKTMFLFRCYFQYRPIPLPTKIVYSSGSSKLLLALSDCRSLSKIKQRSWEVTASIIKLLNSKQSKAKKTKNTSQEYLIQIIKAINNRTQEKRKMRRPLVLN